MMSERPAGAALGSSLAPWLSVRDSQRALQFYMDAFGAIETYHLDTPDGVIARLSIDGAELWVSGETPKSGDAGPERVGGGSVRMILTVADPDALFERAIQAGASAVFPVGEQHGWRLGRLVDPFGLHWEIGRELDPAL